jgi:FkbM family methyltransferase
MVLKLLKLFASKLPESWQLEIRRFYCQWQIRKGDFLTDEPEYAILDSLISPDDWVIDIGANIGHYTKRFSELVGVRGRIIAIEPVPETFMILTSNMQVYKFNNVSLFNIAASDKTEIVGMNIPSYDNGLRNYYEAHITGLEASLTVMSIPLDYLSIPHSVSLIKIDAEGHELAVLRGMKALLERDHPTLIIETGSGIVADYLAQFGYCPKRLKQSPNLIFKTKLTSENNM